MHRLISVRKKNKQLGTTPRKSKEKDNKPPPQDPLERSKKTRSEKEVAQPSQAMTDEQTNREKNIKRKQLVKFVKHVLEKGPSGLQKEFSSMKRFNDFEKMKAFKQAQERGKNRYKDVGCLDNNRVKLAPPWPYDYIHGNYVATPNNAKRFICTQAPLEKTCADFWFMCLQSSNKMKFSKSEAKVMETVLTVEGQGATLKTTHYHWVDWPDRGVPAADMALCELLAKARLSKAPIVVHCSAGIGRTGSVVMIEYMMDQLLSGQVIEDSDKILQKIREQRNNSIQTEHQYLFVHQVMMNYFMEKKMFDENAKLAHLDFTEKYHKAVH
ncbi:hypothetical protein L3Y34_015687 [Caenorhabditis briggsae]|uniref:Uncharacterized protein n=1 Tax=Caenorhabditis briggsae TaxID=6238 RepID=A0AAE9J031_CAEBR|nr:hypothetical protein L3Y34_015687 [Caenorhabditis briggsae]